MESRPLHPIMHPIRHREGHPRLPRGSRARGPKRDHPSWRGRYIHAPAAGPRAQRVTVKTTWHPKGKRGLRSMKAATAYELHYMRQEHDLTTTVDRAIYTQDNDRLSPDERSAFTARTRDDAWQWRVMISPGQGKDLDMTRLTRDVVQQIEKDTGYTLDWVAVNHYNTGHPHSHIIVRGKDLEGVEVGLKRDYQIRGLRYRAMDLATEQLDRSRAVEREHGYQRDIAQEQPLHDRRQWQALDAYERTFQPPPRQDYDQELDRA
jgi:type IV secretory pathway VirD2 relaxase